MKTSALILSLLCVSAFARERQADLTRYPSYSQGRVAFSNMGDIRTTGDNGLCAPRACATSGASSSVGLGQ